MCSSGENLPKATLVKHGSLSNMDQMRKKNHLRFVDDTLHFEENSSKPGPSDTNTKWGKRKSGFNNEWKKQN